MNPASAAKQRTKSKNHRKKKTGSRKITRVYVDMVADLFHYGHVNFLKQASEQGDTLLVGIHADEAVTVYKQKPVLSMEERIRSVEGCRYVDEVIPNAPIEIDREWIETHNIDLILHGDDFSPELEKLCYAVPIELGIFKRIPYTEGISTTELVARVIEARGDQGV